MSADGEGRSLVHSTIQPDRELWVTDAERLDLDRAGLLLDATTSRPEDAGAAPARRPTRTTTSKEG
jgi:hypothetical protein